MAKWKVNEICEFVSNQGRRRGIVVAGNAGDKRTLIVKASSQPSYLVEDQETGARHWLWASDLFEPKVKNESTKRKTI